MSGLKQTIAARKYKSNFWSRSLSKGIFDHTVSSCGRIDRRTSLSSPLEVVQAWPHPD